MCIHTIHSSCPIWLKFCMLSVQSAFHNLWVSRKSTQGRTYISHGRIRNEKGIHLLAYRENLRHFESKKRLGKNCALRHAKYPIFNLVISYIHTHTDRKPYHVIIAKGILLTLILFIACIFIELNISLMTPIAIGDRILMYQGCICWRHEWNIQWNSTELVKCLAETWTDKWS
jgi:hypothetical protein